MGSPVHSPKPGSGNHQGTGRDTGIDYRPPVLSRRLHFAPVFKTSGPPVFSLVNQRTQSQAEDVALGFQLATNVTVIGSTTAGADGAVTKFSLPGGIVTYMSGRGVYYPDGTDLQRKGVKIDEYIEPTIAGIKAGRDEVLERAIEIIEESYKTGNKPKE